MWMFVSSCVYEIPRLLSLLVLACIASKDERCRFAIGAGFGITPSENLPDLPNETRAVANSPVGPVDPVVNGSMSEPVNK